MADYSRALASAQRMIGGAGRLVALQGVSQGPLDPAKPLHGPAPAPAPITGVPAVFVPPSSLQTLGMAADVAQLYARCSQIAIVPDDGINDYAEMKFMTDSDGSEWKIERVDKLKPGDVTLMYFIGVVRP